MLCSAQTRAITIDYPKLCIVVCGLCCKHTKKAYRATLKKSILGELISLAIKESAHFDEFLAVMPILFCRDPTFPEKNLWYFLISWDQGSMKGVENMSKMCNYLITTWMVFSPFIFRTLGLCTRQTTWRIPRVFPSIYSMPPAILQCNVIAVILIVLFVI